MNAMTPYYQDEQVTLYHGDALDVASTIEDGSADCIVTSPPYYGLRDYGTEGQYGLESSPVEYVETMRALFAELRRVLADDGTLWLNIGDSYSGSWGNQGRVAPPSSFQKVDDGRYPSSDLRGTGAIKPGAPPAKNLMGMPWRVAFALQDDGWILRNAIIWNKPNAMPESVTDRLSGRYEHVFLFSKSRRYWFDLDPIREPYTPQAGLASSFARDTKDADVPGQRYRQHRKQRRADEPANAGTGLAPHSGYRGTAEAGRNPGDVWTMPTKPFRDAHFACFPVELPQRCILAGCRPGGTVRTALHRHRPQRRIPRSVAENTPDAVLPGVRGARMTISSAFDALDALIAENSKLRSDLAAARQARDTAQAQATHYRTYYSRTGW